MGEYFGTVTIYISLDVCSHMVTLVLLNSNRALQTLTTLTNLIETSTQATCFLLFIMQVFATHFERSFGS